MSIPIFKKQWMPQSSKTEISNHYNCCRQACLQAFFKCGKFEVEKIRSSMCFLNKCRAFLKLIHFLPDHEQEKEEFIEYVSVQIGRIGGNDCSKKAVYPKIVDQASVQVCNSGVSFSRKNNRSSIPPHSDFFPGSLPASCFAPEEMLHLLHKVQLVILIFFPPVWRTGKFFWLTGKVHSVIWHIRYQIDMNIWKLLR